MALGEEFYFDGSSTEVGWSQEAVEEASTYNLKEEYLSSDPILPNYFTFCIDISNACNLRCDYCFNQEKTGKVADVKSAIAFLEKMFSPFPKGDKYYVDMSGKGEPLLNLKAALDIAPRLHHSREKTPTILVFFISLFTLFQN